MFKWNNIIYRCNEIKEIIENEYKILMNKLLNNNLILHKHNNKLNNELIFITNIKYKWKMNLILIFKELILNIYKWKYINWYWNN